MEFRTVEGSFQTLMETGGGVGSFHAGDKFQK